MSEPSSSDEFDMFLAESEKKVGERDAFEVIRIKVEDIIRDALTDLDYTTVDEDEERARAEVEAFRNMMEDYFRRYDDPDQYDSDLMARMVESHLRDKAAKERLILLFLKISLANALTSGKTNEERDADKRRFFAESFVLHQLSEGDVLYGVINLVLPGQNVVLQASYMSAYLDAAIIEQERLARRSAITDEYIKQAFASVGIEYTLLTEEGRDNAMAAAYMRNIGLTSVNDVEREQALRENLLKVTIDVTVAAKLTEFFIRHKEPKL